MAIADEINKAVGAHGMWKARLKSVIETGKTDLDPEVVAQDNQCEFGKWLYGPTITQADKTADYEKVRQLHARFHKCACATLKKALSGDKKGADDDLSMRGAFSAASGELTTAMMAWKKNVA